MDRTRFSFIAHCAMPFSSPIGEQRVARAIEVMALADRAKVVDFGAGKCEWLARILRRHIHATGTGIEPARAFAGEAGRRHADLIRTQRLEIVDCNALQFLEREVDTSFDAALCIGSTHAFGGFIDTLDHCMKCVRSGGVIAVADGFWKRTPTPEYLNALGGDESEFTTHAGNIERAVGRGLSPLWCSTCTEDEWDEYEWSYSRGIESFVREHPDDPDAQAMLKRSRSWREAYVKWGRDTLGFGLYLLQVP